MILQWLDMGIDFEFQENRINVLVLENQEIYADFMSKLMISLEKGEDSFVLYDNEKKLNLSKNVEVIFSPLLIDLNNKRILTYLYDEMKELSDECTCEKKEQINVEIVSYLDELSQKMPYPVKFRLYLDERQLFKQYDVRIEYDEGCLLEKIMNYIQIQSSLCGIKVLIFTNAKAYFTKEQLQEIYKCAFYNKMHIIMVENIKNFCLKEEKYYIIDKDKCLIMHD